MKAVNIPQLQIQTTPARLSMQTIKPVQEIEQPRATLNIQQPAAILEMSTVKPKLTLDTTENRADIDMKSARRRISENAQYGIQKANEGIVRRAQQGQQLMKIENGATVADIVKQNSDRPMGVPQVKFIGDRSKVQIDFTTGSLDINVQIQKPIIDAQANKPIHNYTPGSVSIDVASYGSIDIDWKV